jgi:hypothetical protein
MARSKKLAIIEDRSNVALNRIRDAERRALNASKRQALQEMLKRAPVDSGEYKNGLETEVPANRLQLFMIAKAPHSVFVEYGTGPRNTESGAMRGQMKGFGVLRKSALRMRREVMSNLKIEVKGV